MAKKEEWFKATTVVDRNRLMQSLAKKRDRNAPLPRLRGARIIDMAAWKHPRVGTRVWYLDRYETMYGTRDLQRILDIDKQTVHRWQKIGLIPSPLFSRKNKYNKVARYYVRPQIAVVAKVVNDLRRQGLLRFTEEKIKHHLAMVANGNEIAVRRWHERRDKSLEKEYRGNGVHWLSDH